jgi:hypothetical protein
VQHQGRCIIKNELLRITPLGKRLAPRLLILLAYHLQFRVPIHSPPTAPTALHLHNMSSQEDARALGHADFWDERYAKASEGEKPSHEWFRGFDALEPFFEKNLFSARGEEGKEERMLHLGSGDSVRFHIFLFA